MNRPPGRRPRSVRYAPLGLILVAVGFDVLTPVDFQGGPLLAAACVLAGATLSLRATLGVGALAVATAVLLSLLRGSLGHVAGGLEAGNVLMVALISVVVNRVIARYGRRLDAVRTVAETAQRAVLPTPPETVGPLRIAARYQAALRETEIGGDLYAVQETPHGTRVLIGDVRGKGLEAVSVVAMLTGVFREAADQSPDLHTLAERLEHHLTHHIARRVGEVRWEGFATALLAEFSPDGTTVRLLNRGHPAPYLLHGGAVRTLEATEADLPLGMGALSGHRSALDTHAFPADSTLLLVTDGVTEARDARGEFYDPAVGLGGHASFPSPQAVIDLLVRDVERWSLGRITDDLAVLAVARPAT
ncbi:PP2C family protein-serine/threonine phosphatase [Streptomyces sp. NPDC021093]|uniref:PP2C family protein-serine/threonine phosphatase n=1 Tax=Streptomyces sp. NPDC021093 TaxID=3365112 RepID=UPI0037AF7697